MFILIGIWLKFNYWDYVKWHICRYLQSQTTHWKWNQVTLHFWQGFNIYKTSFTPKHQLSISLSNDTEGYRIYDTIKDMNHWDIRSILFILYISRSILHQVFKGRMMSFLHKTFQSPKETFLKVLNKPIFIWNTS